MAEWSIAYAWKSDLFTRADAHQIPPTHFRSTSSRNIDTRRRVLVNAGVCPGFRGVCDTVLTQNGSSFATVPFLATWCAAVRDTRGHNRLPRTTRSVEQVYGAQSQAAARICPTS